VIVEFVGAVGLFFVAPLAVIWAADASMRASRWI
jgi:hypothetical protein